MRAANRHAAELCGHKGQRLDGQRLADLLPPAMATTVLSQLEGVTASGDTRSFDVRAPDGRHWYAGHAYPADGGIVLHLHNVTERHNAEDFLSFLADAEALFASVFDEAELSHALARLVVPQLAEWCLIALRDGAGGVRTHAAATRPSVRERVLGLADHVAAADPGALALVAEGLAASTPAMLTRADRPGRIAASDMWALANWIALVPVGGRGGTIGTIVMGRTGVSRAFRADELHLAATVGYRAGLVLQNVRLYEAERRATQLRDDVLAIVAHDLRSPLNTIMLGATALPAAAAPEHQALHDTAKRTVVTAASQMNRLLDDLLNAAHLDTGWRPAERHPVAVSHLIEASVETFRLRAETNGIRLEIHTGDAGDAEVEVDLRRIVEAMGNLLDNALKFTPAGGTVSVTATRVFRGALVTVSDTGPGIAPESLPHLFDRFWQARKHGRAGAGLGLFIARRLVEGHGGRIWAESVPGQGSAFHVALPCCAEAAGESASDAIAGSEAP